MTNKQLSVRPLSELPEKDPFGFVQLDGVEVTPISWIWKPYVPRSALTLLMGDGGYGKSWLTCALAADLSRGVSLPGQDPLPPQRILMISAEDGISQVIKPKMICLGANMENIRASDRGFTLNSSAMTHLVRNIREYDAAIVFLDPLVVYLGGKVDMFRANEARSMLTLLGDVAADTNTAIVAVHHVRKSGDGPQQHKVMGSADFINGVRSGLLVDVSKAGQRYMAHVKSNWAANGPTLAYSFGANGFQWQGEYSGNMEGAGEVSKTPRGAVVQWLKDALAGGPIAAHAMLAEANRRGYTERTVTRAKEGLVKSKNVSGLWVWSLEDGVAELMQLQEAQKMAALAGSEGIIRDMAGVDPLPLAISSPDMVQTDLLAAARAKIAAKRGGQA